MTQSRGTAVLIDLENFLHGRYALLTPHQAERSLRRALALIPDARYMIAIAPPWVIGHYSCLLNELSIPVSVVRAGPNAADMLLLENARHLARIGFRHFAFLSADHIFSSMCTEYRTTVIVRKGQGVSRKLLEAAAVVLAA